MRGTRVRNLLLALLGASLGACGTRSSSHVLPAIVPVAGEDPPGSGITAPGPVVPVDFPPSPSPPTSIRAPFRQFPFTHPAGPYARLAVYDRLSHEVLWFPGAGVGIANVSRLDDGMWAYDDGRDVSVYDSHREERVVMVHGREVGGFAFLPTFATRESMYFLGQSDPELAARGIGWLYAKREEASPSRGTSGATPGTPRESRPPEVSRALGQARWIAPVNALAAKFGGLTSVSVDGQDSAVAFTTTAGRVFVYSPITRKVTSRPNFSEEPGEQHATQVTIDPVWGRYVVWHDTERRTVLVLDRWNAVMEPVPTVRFGMGVVSVSAPGFHETDADTVTVTVTRADGTEQLMAYRLSDGRVETFPVLDAFRVPGRRSPSRP